MEWSSTLEIGVPQIDAQHKELVNRVNKFYDAIKNGDKEEEIIKVLLFIEEYVVTHFRDEEQLQSRSGFPDYPRHKKLHQDFIQQVTDIKADIKKSGFSSATAFMVGTALSNWLVSHISREDKKIGEHIRSL